MVFEDTLPFAVALPDATDAAPFELLAVFAELFCTRSSAVTATSPPLAVAVPAPPLPVPPPAPPADPADPGPTRPRPRPRPAGSVAARAGSRARTADADSDGVAAAEVDRVELDVGRDVRRRVADRGVSTRYRDTKAGVVGCRA